MLDEPMVKDAFDGVEAGLIGAMKASAIGDQPTHHELVLSLQILGRVKRHFEDVILTGRMEAMKPGKT